MKTIVVFFIMIVSFSLHAQDFVYQPANPAFGGNPYNYTWLLSSANAQNKFKDPSETDRGRESELERFTSQLNSQFLGQVSRTSFTEQFGENGLQPGSYTFGSLAVDIYPSEEGLVINILDTNTGEQTQIIIPN